MFELLQEKIKALAPVKNEDLDYFKSLFIARKLKKRQFLMQEGDVCRYQAFVEKGLFRSYTVDDKGAEHILQFASEGWWMADLSSYLTNESSFMNMEALEDSSLLLLTRDSWETAMSRVPALERYFRIIIQNNLVATQKRLLQSLAESAEVKYHRFLETYPDCASRVPQHMIASYLGITRETLSRVRRQMAERK